MSQTSTIIVSTPDSRAIWVACGECSKVTSHKSLTLVKTADASPEGDFRIWDNFLTIQCGGCRTVSFCEQSSCSEDIEYDPDMQEERLSVTTRLYPKRIAGRSKLEQSHLLPYSIYQIYSESIAAICNDQPVLAGIGIRAIIETVCKDQLAKGKDLKEKIDYLAEERIITKDGARILHSLRFMGNEAAHEVKAHTDQELTIALGIAEHTLYSVYIMPKLAEKLPSKQPYTEKKSSLIYPSQSPIDLGKANAITHQFPPSYFHREWNTEEIGKIDGYGEHCEINFENSNSFLTARKGVILH